MLVEYLFFTFMMYLKHIYKLSRDAKLMSVLPQRRKVTGDLSERMWSVYAMQFDHSISCPNDALVAADSPGEAASLLTDYMRRSDLLRYGSRLNFRVFNKSIREAGFRASVKGVLYASYPD